MNIILFGATGMVGQGVLRECLLDSEVKRVLAVGRSAAGQQDRKLREVVHKDFSDFSASKTPCLAMTAVYFVWVFPRRE